VVPSALVEHAANRLVELIRFSLQPLGYLAFVLALGALSAASALLGDSHELGFFAGRVSRMIWRYPEVTRRGVQIAWLAWAVLIVLAVSPVSPTHWDEVVLGALGLAVLWRRAFGARRAAR
jgi:hypothetical protein